MTAAESQHGLPSLRAVVAAGVDNTEVGQKAWAGTGEDTGGGGPLWPQASEVAPRKIFEIIFGQDSAFWFVLVEKMFSLAYLSPVRQDHLQSVTDYWRGEVRDIALTPTWNIGGQLTPQTPRLRRHCNGVVHRAGR